MALPAWDMLPEEAHAGMDRGRGGVPDPHPGRPWGEIGPWDMGLDPSQMGLGPQSLAGLGGLDGMDGVWDDAQAWAANTFQVTPQTFKYVAYGVGALFLVMAFSGGGGGKQKYRGKR